MAHSRKNIFGQSSRFTLALLGASMMMPASQAIADDEAAFKLDEIIVTAQKRISNLQTTSASISVVSGEQLQKQHITSIEGLAQSLPNVNFGQTTGNARIAIRGVGYDNISLGNEGRVAYHVDGVYISRPAATLSSFYDVERVEVLRGPQGTLYGRNATGGAVNVITKTPGDELNGYLRVGVGNYRLMTTEAAVGGPINDQISGRIAFRSEDHDGYGTNLTTGDDVDDMSSRAVRATLRYEPDENLAITLAGDYFIQDDHAYTFHYLGQGTANDTALGIVATVPKGGLFGGAFPADIRNSTSDIAAKNDREFWGLSAHVVAQLGEMELTSITSYRDTYWTTLTDLDAGSAALSAYNQFEDAVQFSEELRLSGEFDSGDWLLGAYYFSESTFGGTRVPLDPAVLTGTQTGIVNAFVAVGEIKTKSWAGFANVSYDVTEQFSIRLGARYSEETKDHDAERAFGFGNPWPGFDPLPVGGAAIIGSETWTSFTPSVTLEYTPSDDLFVYANYSQGFKSGGWNLATAQPAFDPEKLTNWEMGVRGDWMDGRLRTNVSGFYYDYSNLQVSRVEVAAAIIENAAAAEIYGLEAEISTVPVENLNISLNFALLETKFKDFTTVDSARPSLGLLDLSGNVLTQSPKFSANLIVSYNIPTDKGDFNIRGEGRFVDDVFLTVYNLDHTTQEAYQLFNASITWTSPDEAWTATAYMRNITDETVIGGALIGSSLVGLPLIGGIDPPRTFGLTLGYSF